MRKGVKYKIIILLYYILNLLKDKTHINMCVVSQLQTI